jgi:hypothetical protein
VDVSLCPLRRRTRCAKTPGVDTVNRWVTQALVFRAPALAEGPLYLCLCQSGGVVGVIQYWVPILVDFDTFVNWRNGARTPAPRTPARPLPPPSDGAAAPPKVHLVVPYMVDDVTDTLTRSFKLLAQDWAGRGRVLYVTQSLRHAIDPAPLRELHKKDFPTSGW